MLVLLKNKASRLILPVVLPLLLAGAGTLTWGYYYSTLAPVNLDASLKSSVIVVDRRERLLRAFVTQEGRWRLPLSQDDVAPHYFKLLLNFEDKGFYEHSGIEPSALLRALWQWGKNGRIISGGSTLTMQVARLVSGQHKRSISAKLQQMQLALRLEKQLTKREILELYLHLAPFGGNLEGVRAASLSYFGKEPKKLSLSEAATLVALPQSPEMRRPDRFAARAVVARNRVLKRAFDNGVITKADYLFALRQNMPNLRKRFPFHAAHLAEQEVAAQKDKIIIKTTIDRPLQIKLEALAKSHAQRLGDGISTAIFVIDHQSGAIRARVGSADYHDHDRFGPIDMTKGVRSPGSTLKPFIYGLGFDAGLAHPDTLIEDVPVRFGHYKPENFDAKFHGTVTIRHALQKSLNIPAVKMLARVKPARLAARFGYAGIKRNIPNNLAIALGGVGFSLEDLTRAYLHIANPGRAIEPYHRHGETQVTHTKVFKHRPLLSEKAAYYVTHILRGSAPPKNAKPGALAYKTGTSYGYRDGWAIGFDGQYLIGVWIGRPDGGPTTNLTGLGAAGPLLFDAFQHIGEQRMAFKSAPEHIIRGTGDELPPPLRYFDKKQRIDHVAGASKHDRLQISFPPRGAEFYSHGKSAKPFTIALKAEGGKLPLTWLVDGKPISSKAHMRDNFFKSSERGFVEFSVIDALGQTDKVQVRLR